MDFNLIKMGRRPLLAMPGTGIHVRKAAINCYPAHTGKKRAVRGFIQVISRCGLLRWIFPAKKINLPEVSDEDFESWIGSLCGQLNLTEIYPVLVWPADPFRGRIYIYFLDADGHQAGFCKLGLDARNNALIMRERQALDKLQEMHLIRSRVPKLLAAGDLCGHTYLVVETTPENTRIIDWRVDPPIDANVEEFAGDVRLVTRAEMESFPWWLELERTYANNTAFMAAVYAAADLGIEVCRAHGDLNRTNVLCGAEDLWLLDWERSEENAPCLTDMMCIAVDTLWLGQPGESTNNLKKLMEVLPELDDKNTRGNGIMALAFLGAAGFTPALAMIHEWFPEDN